MAPIARPAVVPSTAATYMLKNLELSEAKLALGDEEVAAACVLATHARSMMTATNIHDRVELSLRTRLDDVQEKLIEAVRALDASDIRGRIQGALIRLRGSATTREITDEVAARIALHEDARVQMMFMLGKEILLSWPDHHAYHEIAAELGRMHLEGKVRASMPLAFWRGVQWSAAREA